MVADDATDLTCAVVDVALGRPEAINGVGLVRMVVCRNTVT